MNPILQVLATNLAGWPGEQQQKAIDSLPEKILRGLTRFHVYFAIDLPTRTVNIAGLTDGADDERVIWVTREMLDTFDGFRIPHRCLIHGQDPVFTEQFAALLRSVGIALVQLQQHAGIQDEGFNPDGSVPGFGWEDIFAFGVGIQQDIGEKVKLRVGYNCGQNPVPSRLSFRTAPCPAIAQHHATAGISVKINERLELHAGYYHVFENTDSGQFHSAAGPVPNTLVQNSLSEDSVSIGLTYRF